MKLPIVTAIKVVPKRTVEIMETLKNPSLYFCDLFGLHKGKEIIYKLRNDLKIKLRGGKDHSIFLSMWIKRCYLPPGMEIKAGDIVIDIGAHIGIFSLFAASLEENVRVYAYEPSKGNFTMLQENIELNNMEGNITPFNLGVWGREGSFTLYLSQNLRGHSVLGNWEKGEENIHCVLLSAIFDSNRINECNFLKLDCEGAEYEILYSTPDEYLERIKKISMECHRFLFPKDDYNIYSLKEFLEHKGFEVTLSPASRPSVEGPTGLGLYGFLYAVNIKSQ